jgi:Domain of unknown function (DUF5664)
MRRFLVTKASDFDESWGLVDTSYDQPIELTGKPQHMPGAPDYMQPETRVTSETGGQKGTKLARFDLLPTQPLWDLALHYGIGAVKYDDNNWRKGYDWRLSYAALCRHLSQFWGGEDIDPETGSKHVIAAAWHCLALAEFMDIHPEYDTRLKTVDERAVR